MPKIKKLLIVQGTKPFFQPESTRITNRFLTETKKQNIASDLIFADRCSILILNGKSTLIHKNTLINLKDYSLLFPRPPFGFDFFISLIYELAFKLKLPTLDPINFYKNKICKAVQALKLSGHIKLPKTLICTLNSLQMNTNSILEYFTFPIVLKDANGRRGESVWKINSKKELTQRITALKNNSNAILTLVIQEYVQNNFDLRVFVFKNKIITAFKRSSIDGFYNNFSKGASGELIKITRDEKKMAIKAAKLMKIDFAGVDLFRTKDGPILIEVNKSPMFMTSEKVGKVDMVKRIVSTIKPLLK